MSSKLRGWRPFNWFSEPTVVAGQFGKIAPYTEVKRFLGLHLAIAGFGDVGVFFSRHDNDPRQRSQTTIPDNDPRQRSQTTIPDNDPRQRSQTTIPGTPF